MVQRIDLIEIDRAPKLRSLRSEVADFDRRVVRNFALDFEVPVLDVRNHTVVGADRQRSVGCRNDERHGGWRSRRQRNRQGDVRKRSVRGRRIRHTRSAGADQIDSGNRADGVVHSDEIAQRAGIVDAVSGSKNRLAFAEPRNVPAQSDCGRKIVQVVALAD